MANAGLDDRHPYRMTGKSQQWMTVAKVLWHQKHSTFKAVVPAAVGSGGWAGKGRISRKGWKIEGGGWRAAVRRQSIRYLMRYKMNPVAPARSVAERRLRMRPTSCPTGSAVSGRGPRRVRRQRSAVTELVQSSRFPFWFCRRRASRISALFHFFPPFFRGFGGGNCWMAFSNSPPATSAC